MAPSPSGLGPGRAPPHAHPAGPDAQVLGLEAETLLGPFDHGLAGVHLFGDARRRRLDIDDDRLFHVDQIVEAVAEHHLVAAARRPGRRGIRRRQLPAKPTQIDYTVDPARQMIARHHVIKTKLIEQTLLPTHLLTHYDSDPLAEWPLGGEDSIISSTHASY